MTAPLDPKNDWVAKNPSDPESEWRYTHDEQNLIAENIRWIKDNLGGGGGGGGANLTTTRTATTVTVVSDSGTDAAIPAADTTNSGVMTAADRVKFATIATNADVTNATNVAAAGALMTSAAPELIRDTIGTALVQGANVTITPNDAGDTITIAATGGAGGATNLTTSRTATTMTVLSDTGTDATLVAADGTNAGVMTAAQQVLLTGAIQASTKNQPNGVAGLNASGQVAAAQLPGSVDELLEYANFAAFPAVGATDKMYVALDTGLIYRWGGTVYSQIPSSPGTTDEVPEGAANLYYTNARVATAPSVTAKLDTAAAPELIRDTIGTALVAGTNVTITPNDAGDTIAISATPGAGSTNLTTSMTPTAVTVLSDTGTDAIIAAADTVNAGVMTVADRNKFTGIATGATANSPDATLLGRANHTGTQTASTISDFSTAADARVVAGITGKLDTSAAPELIRDTIGTALVAGSNVTITPSDVGDTITIASTGGGGGGTATNGDLYNFAESNTRRFQRGMGKALAGTGYSDHLLIGDSLSSSFTGTVFDFPGSWHRRLKTGLVADGYPDGGSGWVAVMDGDDVTIGYDPRITRTGTWLRGDDVGTYIVSTVNGSTCTFTSTGTGTAVDVLYAADSGTFSVKIDAAAAVNVTPTGGEWSTYTVTGLANTTHTVIVTATNTTPGVSIGGFQVRQTTGLRFHNLGVKYGWDAVGWLASGAFPGMRNQILYAMPTPDVVHIALGANDINNGTTPAATITAIQGIRNLFPSSDCILYLEPELSGMPAGQWATFATSLYTLADTLDAPLVNLSKRWGTPTQYAANGLQGGDGFHPNATAQADWTGLAREGIHAALGTEGSGGGSGGGSTDLSDTPRFLKFSSVWPARPNDNRLTFWVGGATATNAPVDVNLRTSDVWIPAS